MKPWFLINDWWWKNVADRAMHREWQEIMRECSALARSHDNADILASWALDDTIGASATVTLRTRDGYVTALDGPCTWDRASGEPPPWWFDGIPAALVRQVNAVTCRIARAHHAWAYGPMLREYYHRRP